MEFFGMPIQVDPDMPPDVLILRNQRTGQEVRVSLRADLARAEQPRAFDADDDEEPAPEPPAILGDSLCLASIRQLVGVEQDGPVYEAVNALKARVAELESALAAALERGPEGEGVWVTPTLAEKATWLDNPRSGLFVKAIDIGIPPSYMVGGIPSDALKPVEE